MNLQDAHIVLDGYNLQRPQGTGIKTYGLALARALAALGARVSILWEGRGGRDPLVREASLFDRDPEGGMPRPGRASFFPALKSLLGGSAAAAGHAPTRWVIPNPPEDDLAPLAHRFYSVPGCYAAAHRLCRLTGAPLRVKFRDPVDAWHATAPLPVRVRGVRQVTTVHDLIPLRLPWATLDSRALFHRTVRLALDRSALVLAVSEHTKRDLVEVFGADPGRIHVTYEPCAPSGGAAEDAAAAGIPAAYGLRRGEYALFVGAIEPKKNVGRLLMAWRALEAPIPLVLAGGKGWLWKDELRPAAALLESKRVLHLDYVPRSHLRGLYADARFFVFPSLYEGFGLPPLEAMAHGCPVLTSNVSSLPEVCGEAALYCDPYDVGDIAEKMRALLRDDALRAQLAAKGRERSAFFSMENYQKRLADAYAQL